MKSNSLFRTVLPLLAFVAAFTGTAGLTLSAADSKAQSKPKKGTTAEKKPAAAASTDGDRAPLKISVDSKAINREGYDRVSYAPIIKRTASSVVYVHSSKTVKGQDLSQYFNDPLFRRFFGIPGAPGGDDEDGTLQPDEKGRTPRSLPKSKNRKGGGSGGGTPPRSRTPDQVQQGLGSGVVITADGYILTNNHVIEGADDVKVSIGEAAKRYEAKVVGRDSFADVAVLKIEATGLTPATFGDSEQLQVGDVVLAIGNPFGVGQSVSRGIVSALSRGVGIGPIEDFIQTDAAINPGNSGGALIDTEGRLVGINTAILSRSGGFAGVGFAIPINLVRNIAEQLVNKGKVDRAFLGIAPQDLTEDLISQFGAEKGAIISEVTTDSPAEKAGLKAGDVITKINATEIRDSRHLLLTISWLAPESEVTVEYLRNGKKATVDARLARRPDQLAEADAPAPEKDEGVLNGVGVGDITKEIRDQLNLPARIRGALITSVEPDSPSGKQGLKEGDIILELDRRPVANAEQAVKLSEEIKGPKVLVLIWRNGRTRYLAIDESKE
jgi:serine protease Do